jgi:hypothetical protein
MAIFQFLTELHREFGGELSIFVGKVSRSRDKVVVG